MSQDQVCSGFGLHGLSLSRGIRSNPLRGQVLLALGDEADFAGYT